MPRPTRRTPQLEAALMQALRLGNTRTAAVRTSESRSTRSRTGACRALR